MLSSLQITEFLKAHKEQINGSDETGRRYFSLAAGCNYQDVVQIFLNAGADIDLPNTDDLGYTPLMIAANEGKAEMVLFLLNKGANLEATDTIGRTVLFRACIGAYAEILVALLKRGAKVDAVDMRGTTPLQYICEKAMEWGSMQIFETVAGKEVKRANPRIFEHLEIVKILLKNGADINSFSESGFSPLHYSAHTGNSFFVKELIDQGAIVDPINSNGYSPLHAAADNSCLDCARLLVENGADVNREDKYGFRPIHGAVDSGSLEMVELLMKGGARPQDKVKEGYKDIKSGFSAIDIAKLRKNSRILKLLKG